jgi:hypothetical protein
VWAAPACHCVKKWGLKKVLPYSLISLSCAKAKEDKIKNDKINPKYFFINYSIKLLSCQ